MLKKSLTGGREEEERKVGVGRERVEEEDKEREVREEKGAKAVKIRGLTIEKVRKRELKENKVKKKRIGADEQRRKG